MYLTSMSAHGKDELLNVVYTKGALVCCRPVPFKEADPAYPSLIPFTNKTLTISEEMEADVSKLCFSVELIPHYMILFRNATFVLLHLIGLRVIESEGMTYFPNLNLGF